MCERRGAWFTRLLLVGALLAPLTGAADLNVTFTDATAGVLPHFWRSCGYSPAEVALRLDGTENTARIGSLPAQAIAQVRIHFLLDLVIVTGFLPSPSAPSGYQLMYNWVMLDYVLDSLVANNLKPGFEIFGSPMGFPPVPQSFWSGWANNFKVTGNQTCQLFRTLVTDVIVRYANRYGPQVSQWNFELWNEPDSGWGWTDLKNETIAAAYLAHWDAVAAGVADAEAATGLKLVLGGPGAGKYPGVSPLLPWVFGHLDNGTNIWTGAPPRLDFLSIHYKGVNTSWKISDLALAGFTWMREPGHAGPRAAALPFYNDEADPLVSWMIPLAWRADARYGAIIPKVINQHVLRILDNTTNNNPLGLLSNDNGFMNADGYNGFEQRTLLARFSDPSTGRYAFVRKPGIHAMALLSKLGTQRLKFSGAAGPDAVAHSPTGVLATASTENGGSIAVLVYNSNDTTADAAAGVTVNLRLTVTPFSPTANLTLVHYRLDMDHGNAYAVWLAQGSPELPSSAQIRALWAADGLLPIAPPMLVERDRDGSLTIPTFDLPQPGVSLLHVVASPIAEPPAPTSVRPYAKPQGASLLDVSDGTEVLCVWDCLQSSQSILGHVVQFATAGANGPWTDAGAPRDDFSCSFLHVAPSGAGTQLWYRVAAVNYDGVQGAWSASVQAMNWPAPP